MFDFDIQLFATYSVEDLATVGQVKTLAVRITARLTALETPKAIRGVKIEDNKIKFYDTTDTTKTPLTSVDLPEELYLNQTQTEIVEDFAFNAETYKGATDPDLDGKTVLVLAVKGDGEPPTVKYSFVNMSSVISDYVPKVDDATAGDIPMLNSDGSITSSTISSGTLVTKSGAATAKHIMIFDENGKAIDSGHGIATDEEFAAMLDEVGLPSLEDD